VYLSSIVNVFLCEVIRGAGQVARVLDSRTWWTHGHTPRPPFTVPCTVYDPWLYVCTHRTHHGLEVTGTLSSDLRLGGWKPNGLLGDHRRARSGRTPGERTRISGLLRTGFHAAFQVFGFSPPRVSWAEEAARWDICGIE
jgi:hypothetical protein